MLNYGKISANLASSIDRHNLPSVMFSAEMPLAGIEAASEKFWIGHISLGQDLRRAANNLIEENVGKQPR